MNEGIPSTFDMTLAHLLPPGEGKGGALGLHRGVVDLRHIEFNAGGTAGLLGLLCDCVK